MMKHLHVIPRCGQSEWFSHPRPVQLEIGFAWAPGTSNAAAALITLPR